LKHFENKTRMGATRICIFCGRPPSDKDNEHPLPMWLLRLTGDPNRVVRHGAKWSTGKAFEFSYDSLKFPSCAACNRGYSTLEGNAKDVVERICRYEAVEPAGYVTLLDWLDKVRIGLWLGHKYLQGNPSAPTFTIDSRIGTKDRMVAVYVFHGHAPGLNTFGVETPLFQHQPSVFALRVNTILFLNASWDWMCASRCAYPFPRSRTLDLDVGAVVAGDYRCSSRIVHPIMSGLHKPTVLLFQPILQGDMDALRELVSRECLQRCLDQSWPERPAVGPLFRQYSHETVRTSASSPPVAFDVVRECEARSLVDVATQTYQCQIDSLGDAAISSADPQVVRNYNASKKALIAYNRLVISKYRSIPPKNFRQLWGR